METYQKREQKHSLVKWGISAAAVAAVVIGRKKLGAYAISGLERVAAGVAKTERRHAQFAINEWVASLAKSTEHAQRTAAVQIGSQRMTSFLSKGDDILGVPGWQQSQINTLFGKNAEHSWFFAGAGRDTRAIENYLGRDEFAELVTGMGGRTRVAEMIEEARRQANLGVLHNPKLWGNAGKPGGPALTEVEHILSQTKAVEIEHQKAFWEYLEQQSRRPGIGIRNAGRVGWGRQLLHASGTSEVTLSQLETVSKLRKLKPGSLNGIEDSTLEQLTSTREHIVAAAKALGKTDAELEHVLGNVRIEGLYRVDGAFKDLRGLKDATHKALGFAETHFQIPIIPYVSGFNPLSMMPWLRGTSKTGAHFFRYTELGKQFAIKDLVSDGTSMSVIGNRAVAMKFSEQGDAFARTVQDSVSLLDTSGGFGRRFAENIIAHNKHTPTGKTVVDALSLDQHQASYLTKFRSIFSKFKNERYPGQALDLITKGSDSPEAVRSLTKFLHEHGNLSPETVRRLANEAPELFSGTPIEDIITRLDDGDALLDWFYTHRLDSGDSGISSGSLRRALKSFDKDPSGFINKKHQLAETDFYSVNIMGSPTPETGVDLMRKAIMDEYVQRALDPIIGKAGRGAIDDIISRLRSLGLSSEELNRAEAFVHGSTLSSMVHSGNLDSARSYLTQGRFSSSAKTSAGFLVDKELGILDTFIIPQHVDDVPGKLIIRDKESILEFVNSEIKAGKSVPEMMIDFTGSKAFNQGLPAFFKGPGSSKQFTTGSLGGYFMAERLNTSLADMHLAVGPKFTGSGASILWGLISRRVLPGWAAYEAWNYLNFESEEALGTSPRELLSNLNANRRLARSWASEHLLPIAAGKVDELMPGYDRSLLGIVLSGNTVEEEREQLAHGYEPIRQGRYWFFGSRTQLYGDKVKYYLPDSHQRAHSNWMAADNADLASKDYWEHYILPTPRYPLSPVSHFLDAYWWERKHAEGDNPDRPYVVSGPMFSPETPWGPALNSTVGRIFKPKRVLHPEYDPESFTPDKAYYGFTPTSGDMDFEYEERDDWEYAYGDMALSSGSYARVMPAGALQLQGRAGGGGGSGAGSGAGYGSGSGGYGGSGGGGYGLNRASSRRVKSELKNRGYFGTPGGRARLKDLNSPEIVGYLGDPTDITDPSNTDRTVDSIKELSGIYGWGASVLLNKEYADGMRMDDPSAAYGASSRFWNAQLGGLGGSVSEIGRRFLYKRPGTVEYYNPVPNQFAGTWLPGSAYFNNLQRGDPHGKLENGLLRLPGEAYERAHGVKLMLTRASSVGKSEDELLLELIHQKEPLDEEAERVTGIGTALHKAVQAKWRRMGILKGAEIEMFDPVLGASGHIDALLNMGNREVIGEIKTMSERRYNAGKLFDEHRAQINLYMHATGVHEGLMVYANRDNPGEVRSIEVPYSEALYKATLRKVNRARARAEKLVSDGVISRADLYDDVTRFEILSDVCVSKDTPVIMKDYTFKYAAYLNEGDTVISHTGSSCRVLKKSIRGPIPILKRIVSYGCSAFPLDVTPEHPILVIPKTLTTSVSTARRHAKKGGYSPSGSGYKTYLYDKDKAFWCKAQDLQKDYAVIYPIPKRDKPVSEINITNLSTEQITVRPSDQWFHKKRKGCNKFTSPTIKINELFCYVAGIYLAEGSVNGYTNKKHRGVIFSLSSDEEYTGQKVAEFLKSISESAVVVKTKPSTSSLYISTSNTVLGEFFSETFGGYSHNKHIPGFVFNLSSELQAKLLFGLFEGNGCCSYRKSEDGSSRQFTVELTTVSETLVLNVRDLLAQNGFVSLIKKRNRSDGLGKTRKPVYTLCMTGSDAWDFYVWCTGKTPSNCTTRPKERAKKVWIDGDYLVSNIKSIADIEYNDYVYNWSIETDNSFCTPSCATHNCPYSDQFYSLREYISAQWANQSGGIDKAQFERFKAAKKRAMRLKERYALDGYRFSGNSTDTKTYTVEQVLDANTIKVRESDRPIRLAGVKATNELLQDYLSAHPGQKEYGSPAAEIYTRLYGIRPGTRVKAAVSSDPADRYGKDMFETERVTLYAGGKNVNQDMLSRDLAKERDTDYSGAGVKARFTTSQRMFGSLYEKVAHLDTPINTKMLRVRSPYEEYVRGQVYGKTGGTWSKPISSYVTPTIEAYLSRDPILAGISMGAFATMFGRTKYMKGKLAIGGAILGAVGATAVKSKELVTGEPYIPRRVRRRRDIEEYYDILKYMKYSGLSEYAASRAKDEEGVDVDELIAEEEHYGEMRKNKSRRLTREKVELKKQILSAGPQEQLAAINENIKQGKRGKRGINPKEELSIINNEIKRLSSFRRDYTLGPWATQAIMYKQMADSTMYGADPGNFRQVMGTLPKYEREILVKAVTQSTEKERKSLYRLLPDYEKRLLGPYLGIKDSTQKPDLSKYFKTHTLPDSNWSGWAPDMDLTKLKARTIKYEGLDPMDFGIYPQSMEQAEKTTQSVDIPTVRGSSSDIEQTLSSVMSGKGLKNLRISVSMVPDSSLSEDTVDVNLSLRHDRRRDLIESLRRY